MTINADYMNDEDDYRESLELFLEDLEHSYGDSEYHLIKLENDPSNGELINSVFRTVHTLKGSLNYIGVTEFTPMVHVIEDILQALQEKKLPYDSVMGDLILLAMDLSKIEVSHRLRKGKAAISPKHIENIICALQAVASAKDNDCNTLIREAVLLMDPQTALSAEHVDESSGIEKILKASSISLDGDIKFFIRQAYAIDERSHFWEGRCERVLSHCLQLNSALDCPVAPEQLAVAALIHDIGMAYLPIDVLHKGSNLNSDERQLINSHAEVGHRLIKCMERWQIAADIILQHHEKEDGTGYPKALTGKSICSGAKILAIVDAYEACTHDRAYITCIKRPTLRATLVLNHGAGEQFDENYVKHFVSLVADA